MKYVLSYLLKALAYIAVVGILALTIGLFLFSLYKTSDLVMLIFYQNFEDEGEILIKALKAIDLILLSIIFSIIAIGFYELFIGDVPTLPEWLEIQNIDQLKGMLVKVIILVMGISFTGRIITWNGQTDLMGYGLGLASVIFALSFFLKIKKTD